MPTPTLPCLTMKKLKGVAQALKQALKRQLSHHSLNSQLAKLRMHIIRIMKTSHVHTSSQPAAQLQCFGQANFEKSSMQAGVVWVSTL